MESELDLPAALPVRARLDLSSKTLIFSQPAAGGDTYFDYRRLPPAREPPLSRAKSKRRPWTASAAAALTRSRASTPPPPEPASRVGRLSRPTSPVMFAEAAVEASYEGIAEPLKIGEPLKIARDARTRARDGRLLSVGVTPVAAKRSPPSRPRSAASTGGASSASTGGAAAAKRPPPSRPVATVVAVKTVEAAKTSSLRRAESAAGKIVSSRPRSTATVSPTRIVAVTTVETAKGNAMRRFESSP